MATKYKSSFFDNTSLGILSFITIPSAILIWMAANYLPQTGKFEFAFNNYYMMMYGGLVGVFIGIVCLSFLIVRKIKFYQLPKTDRKVAYRMALFDLFKKQLSITLGRAETILSRDELIQLQMHCNKEIQEMIDKK